MKDSLEDKFGVLVSAWRMGEISDAKMALNYFLYYYLKKHPNKRLACHLDSGHYSFEILDLYQFKKIKQKAVDALKMWCKDEWSFKLSEKIYTPFEVLQFQCLGIRPVTIKFQAELTPILHKEDCLDFFLHDLEHGYMFNFDQDLRNMQIHFFNNVKNSLQTNLWDKYLERENFKERFHYLISDMNTHIEHYKGYLYSQIDPDDRSLFDYLFLNNSCNTHSASGTN